MKGFCRSRSGVPAIEAARPVSFNLSDAVVADLNLPVIEGVRYAIPDRGPKKLERWIDLGARNVKFGSLATG